MKTKILYIATVFLTLGFVSVANAYTVVREEIRDGRGWKEIRCESGTLVYIHQSADGSGKWVDGVIHSAYVDWQDLVKKATCRGRGE